MSYPGDTLEKATRLFHTVRYLRPRQIVVRAWNRFYRPLPSLSPAPLVQAPRKEWTRPSPKPVSMVGADRFRFLNVERTASTALDWNHTGYPKLWLYNLHYFDDLNAADATCTARLASEIAFSLDLRRTLPRPVTAGSRIPYRFGWSTGSNGCLRAGTMLPAGCIKSLAVQVRYLRQSLEYHLLGNHLFANAKALVFAGLFFEGPEAEAWLAKALRILSVQVPEQVLKDGGHFERSPMYHAIIQEDLLDLINLFGTFERPIPPEMAIGEGPDARLVEGAISS